MIPLGDSPNPRGIPIVNYLLIAINVAIFALVTFPLSSQPADPGDPLLPEYMRVISEYVEHPAQLGAVLESVSAYDLFTFRYGFRPAEPSLIAFFFSMFLHGGLMHLFGNMLFLWIYGDNVEHRLGRMRYLVSYLATGAAATLGHWALNSSSPIPSVGASGAISGVLGFYFVFFPHNKVRVLLPFFPFFLQVVHLPARLILGLYLFVDNIVPLLLTGGSPGGVAHGAHIGGFVAGLALAWIVERRGVQARPAEYARAPETAPRAPGETIAQAIRLRDYEHAARQYFSLPAERTRRLLPPENSLALADWLAQEEHGEAALAVYLRHLRDYPDDETTARAHLGAGWVLLRDQEDPTTAYQHFVDALQRNPSPEIEEEIREGLARIAAMQKLALRGVREKRTPDRA